MTTRSIEIFKPGTFTAMDGKSYPFTAADLKASAAAYDPARHEAPIVVGHPKHDGPAFGWIKGLRFENDRLVADPDQVDEAFAEMVKAGRFKKISAAFYEPTSPANPKPGSWYLRHVGFLGAMAPSVKGLRQIEFSSNEDGVVEFGDMQKVGGIFRDVASVLQRLRDWVIDDRGLEQADKMLPSWQIESITERAARLDEQPVGPAYAEPNDPEDKTVTDKATADADARQTELDARQADLDARQKEIERQTLEARRADDARFIDGLVTEGRVLPAEKVGLAAFMSALDEKGSVEFGEGDDAKKTNPRAFLQGFLKALPPRVDFAERAAGQGSEAAATTGPAFAEQIVAEQKKALDETGTAIPASEAARRIKHRAA